MAATYQLNFEVPVLTLKGVPMKDEDGTETVLGKVLGDHIGGAAGEKNVVKLYGWASKMSQSKAVELDSEDFNSLKAFVELLPRLPILVKAQALEIFNVAKPVEKG